MTTHRAPAVAGLCARAIVLGALVGCAELPPRSGAPASAPAGQAVAQSSVRAASLRQHDEDLRAALAGAEAARQAGRFDEATSWLERARQTDPTHPRLGSIADDIARSQRQQRWLERAKAAAAAGRSDEAEALLRRLLAESPGSLEARSALLALDLPPMPPRAVLLTEALRKTVTIEFRDAPLRAVLDGLNRAHGINFVLDRDVRGDAKVTVLLRGVTLEEALGVILASQQLERKLLNERTLLIYPATAAKQREHQEWSTRSFYLANTHVKQAQGLVRTIAKSRDVFVDERLNLLMVRDSPEVLRLIERLLGAIDLPEPEVVLDVEVLEISSSRLDQIGLQWPETVEVGITGSTGQVNLGDRDSFRASVANPALLATLRASVARGDVLANPRLRVRNHEKAKVMIGEKLPVFTTTSTANVGVSTAVTTIDVGLKLEVEPSVQLDNDVVIKVGLDVSTLIAAVPGPQGSIGYRVGTRQATTSLRLRDGETQVLAGLIQDADLRSVTGVPGLSTLPLLGRLFGKHADDRNKTEIVLLITPRVVRNLGLPPAALAAVPSGVEANPGASPLRLGRGATAAVGIAAGRAPPGAAAAAGAAATPAAAAAAAASAAETESRAPAGTAVLTLATSGRVEPGATASVSLRNASAATIRGELLFDPTLLAPAQAGSAADGRVAFELAPGADQVVIVRPLPAANGQTVTIAVSGAVASGPAGEAIGVTIDGEGTLQVGGSRP